MFGHGNHLALRPLIAGSFLLLTATSVSSEARRTNCLDDAMLVFDASRSMMNVGDDSHGRSRISEARDALSSVLPQVAPFRNLGLVVYGPGKQNVCGHIDLRLRPTPDAAAAILDEIKRIEPDGDTPLTEAVREAAVALNHRERPGAVVLVTGGRETCGGSPCDLAYQLMLTSVDLTVHVIGFKTQISSFEWQSFGDDDVNRNTEIVARCLADRTGGTFVTAQTTDDLVAALRDALACPVVSEVRRQP